MSTPLTFRLLEPRALTAVDRLVTRLDNRQRSFLRGSEDGVPRLADRIFDSWVGRRSELARTESAGAGPSTGMAPEPPVDAPLGYRSVRGELKRAPARVLVALPRAGTPAEEPRARELVEAARSQPPRGLGAATETERASGLSARLLERLAAVDALLRSLVAREAIANEEAARATGRRERSAVMRMVAPALIPPAPAPPAVPPPQAPIRAAREGVALDPMLSVPAPPTWARLQRFLEPLAGPVSLAQAGVVDPAPLVPRRLAPASRPLVAPLDREPVAPEAAVPRATVPPFVGSTSASIAQPSSSVVVTPPLDRAPVEIGETAPGKLRLSPVLTPVAPATLFGELEQQLTALAVVEGPASSVTSARPGRLAQRAELVSQLAEQRTEHQLGLAPRLPSPRSVRRSADAFTYLELGGQAETERELLPARRGARPLGPAPLSIAALLAFVDGQLGPKLLGAAQPMPVLELDRAPERASEPAPIRAAAPRVLIEPGSMRSVEGSVEATPPPEAAVIPRQPAASPALSVAPIGRRSEQLAGEVGMRVGSLSSEFLFDPVATVARRPEVSAPVARTAQMSTSEWVLLSMFPSQATANQVADAIGAREARGPAASRPMIRTHAPERTSLASAEPSSTGTMRGVDAAPLASNVLPLRRGLDDLGPRDPASDLAPAIPAPSRPPLTVLLPDGRLPRGNRLRARAAMPTIDTGHAGSAVIQAGVEAAARRAEAPVGAPLWNHLRPVDNELVAPAARPEVGSRTAAALELVAPFIEQPGTQPGAASFVHEALPVVAGRPPDEPSQSLVTALAAAATHASSDRLSLADLTLISIVSAADQVAASARGATPAVAAHEPGAQAARTPGQGSVGRASDSEIDQCARMVIERRKQMKKLYASRGGRSIG